MRNKFLKRNEASIQSTKEFPTLVIRSPTGQELLLKQNGGQIQDNENSEMHNSSINGRIYMDEVIGDGIRLEVTGL